MDKSTSRSVLSDIKPEVQPRVLSTSDNYLTYNIKRCCLIGILIKRILIRMKII